MAHRLHRFGPLVAAGLALSACGQSFNELERDYVGAADRLSRLSPTPLIDMPDSGSARYDGVAFVGFGTEGFGSTASRITLNADFGEGHVNGRMTNWALDRDNRIDSRLDGELRVFGGRISGNTLTASAMGQLDDGSRMGAVVLELDGRFVGHDAQGIVGSISGSAGYMGRDVEPGLVEIDGGVFNAERR
jgi:hypothetical protein